MLGSGRCKGDRSGTPGLAPLPAVTSLLALHLGEQLGQVHAQGLGYPVEVDDAYVALVPLRAARVGSAPPRPLISPDRPERQSSGQEFPSCGPTPPCRREEAARSHLETCLPVAPELALAGRRARSLSPPTISSSRPPRHSLRSPGAHVADVGSFVIGAE
jgi:hypothetical protein